MSSPREYRLLGRVAETDFAETFRAVAKGPGEEPQPAHVHFLRQQGSRAEVVLGLKKQVAALSAVRFPNLIVPWEVGRVGERWAFTTPAPLGHDLGMLLSRSWSRELMVPLGQAVHIIAEAAGGLAALHQVSLCHGGIGPEDVVLCLDGNVRLHCSGARYVLESVRATQHLAQRGRKRYRAPERSRGAGPSPTSDVFALGAVGFELITGHAFEGAPRPGGAVRAGSKRVPSRLDRRIPAKFDPVIMRAVEIVPARRYEDAAAFRDALWEYLDSMGEVVTPAELAELAASALPNEVARQSFDPDQPPASSVPLKDSFTVDTKDEPGLQREARRVRGGAGGIGEAQAGFAGRASDGPPDLKAVPEPSVPADPVRGEDRARVGPGRRPAPAGGATAARPKDTGSHAALDDEISTDAGDPTDDLERSTDLLDEGRHAVRPRAQRDERVEPGSADEGFVSVPAPRGQPSVARADGRSSHLAGRSAFASVHEPSRGAGGREPRSHRAEPEHVGDAAVRAAGKHGSTRSVQPGRAEGALPPPGRSAAGTARTARPAAAGRPALFDYLARPVPLLLVIGVAIVAASLGFTIGRLTAPAPPPSSLSTSGFTVAPEHTTGAEPEKAAKELEAVSSTDETEEIAKIAEPEKLVDVDTVETAGEKSPPATGTVRRSRARKQPVAARGASVRQGRLTVQADRRAKVLIDGRDTGRYTPLQGYLVPAGRREVTLLAGDGTSHVETVVIRRNEVTVMRAELR